MKHDPKMMPAEPIAIEASRGPTGLRVGRFLGGAAALALVTGALAACGGGSTAPVETTAQEQTTAPASAATASPEPTAATSNNSAALSPDTAEVVNRLEAMNYDEFAGSTTPEERAIWCEGEINPDLRVTAATWHQQTGNPFDILPEATTTNTPQEIITLINYQVRQATITHEYEPGSVTFFDIEKTRKAFACVNFDTYSGFAKSQDAFVNDSYNSSNAFGHYAEGVALQGSLPMETAVDSREPSDLPGGYWSQDIQARDGINGTSTDWRNIARVEYPFNGETHVMYMINTSDNAPNN